MHFDLTGHSPGCLWAFVVIDLWFLGVGAILGAGTTLLVYLFIDDRNVENDETLSFELENKQALSYNPACRDARRDTEALKALENS